MNIQRDNNGLVIPAGWRKRDFKEIIENGDMYASNAASDGLWNRCIASVGKTTPEGLGKDYTCITPSGEYKIGDRIKVVNNPFADWTGKIIGEKFDYYGKDCYPILMDKPVTPKDVSNTEICLMCFCVNCLKVDDELKVGQYFVEFIDKDNISVGCQKITRDQIEKVLSRLNKMK